MQGLFAVNMLWAGVAAAGIVLGAAYMLWLYQRTMFGKIDNPKNEGLLDLNLREISLFVPLLILAFWIGLYPKPFLCRLDTSVSRVISRVSPQYDQVNLNSCGSESLALVNQARESTGGQH